MKRYRLLNKHHHVFGILSLIELIEQYGNGDIVATSSSIWSSSIKYVDVLTEFTLPKVLIFPRQLGDTTIYFKPRFLCSELLKPEVDLSPDRVTYYIGGEIQSTLGDIQFYGEPKVYRYSSYSKTKGDLHIVTSRDFPRELLEKAMCELLDRPNN